MTYKLSHVSLTDPRILKLIEDLNNFQINLYGVEKCTLESPEQMLRNGAFMIGAFLGEDIIGMGAVKLLDSYGEIKRMYVRHDFRGKGIASRILAELENHVSRNGISTIKLETGSLHFEAMALYEKHGFVKCSRFGDYAINDISVYFQKEIRA